MYNSKRQYEVDVWNKLCNYTDQTIVFKFHPEF